MLKLFSKLLDLNQREIDRLQKIVDQVNSFDSKVKKLKDKDFGKKTEEFRKRVEKDGKLEDVLPEAFAVAREASWRSIGLRPYDVQIMASVALFEGKVVEQKTGEGKTLSAVPALYLRGLTGKGAHLVTVNDYLARRDAGWMGPVFDLLGLTVGSIVQEQKSYIYDPEFSDASHGDERLAHLKPTNRREVYSADITYGTNNEFGFDYLRDNMVSDVAEMVQRGHNFAIVDEVDSVLIDEARTPLIISAPDTDPTDKYYKFAELINKLNADTDYKIDEKFKTATLTEHGILRVEKLLGVDNLYEKDYDAIHHIENALRARTLFLKDRDYVVKEGKVTIVDEFTGRLMFGRRWSDGLHQAVEAKEGVVIQQESKTLATISFQNYFRMYETLSGMTGTAATEAEEFKKIYDLDVVVVPTNNPLVRDDMTDIVYKSVRAKYGAVVADIEEKVKKGRPILVGTTSIEKNEIISSLLHHKKVKHNVLNAKNHEKEAMIISDAGKPGAVTVATNMAGRGVDIVLGGSMPDRPTGVTSEKFKATSEYKKWKSEHEKVVKAGGLHVIGTERHESRRIDNQLRGRAGRQGDPGSTRFYLSLEDDLMRIFGGEQMIGIMNRLKLPEDQPIENKLISRSIEQAQVKVEGFNFDSRKGVVEYDDVINQQRDYIYTLRKKVLTADTLKDEIKEILHKEGEFMLLSSQDTGTGKLDMEKFTGQILEIVPFDDKSIKNLEKHFGGLKGEAAQEEIDKIVSDIYDTREKQFGTDVMRKVERFAYLGSIDKLWIDHIDTISGLREGVRLRAYGQRDPLVEFKQEAYALFENLLKRIDSELSGRIFRINVATSPRPEIPLNLARTNVDTTDSQGLAPMGEEVAARASEKAFTKSVQGDSNSNTSTSKKKLGRNDPCWCGSGKKWKKCHYPQLG